MSILLLMDFEEFVRLYLTYSVPGDMTVSKLKEVANKIVKKHLEDTLDAMDPLLKTVKAQLDEGIVTICSKCQRLTYNVDCFVCRWCNLQAVVDNVLDYCSKNHDNFEQRDNGDVYCSECGLIVHSFAKEPVVELETVDKNYAILWKSHRWQLDFHRNGYKNKVLDIGFVCVGPNCGFRTDGTIDIYEIAHGDQLAWMPEQDELYMCPDYKQPIPTLHVGGPVPTDPTEPTPDKAA